MSRVRIVFTALLAVAAMAVMAVPASASVPAANAKFCKAAAKIGSDANNASAFNQAKAKKLQSQFKAAAKNAPPKVKAAVGNITKLLGLIAGTTNPADLPKVYTSDAFKKYPNAVTTFFTYQATQCAGT
jgi:hypothetical protein